MTPVIIAQLWGTIAEPASEWVLPQEQRNINAEVLISETCKQNTVDHLQVSFGSIQTSESGLDGSEGSVHYLMSCSVGQIVPKLCRGFGAVHRGHQPLLQRVTAVAYEPEIRLLLLRKSGMNDDGRPHLTKQPALLCALQLLVQSRS